MQIFDPGNEFHFCGFYRYVNGGVSVTYDLKPMGFMIVSWIILPVFTHWKVHKTKIPSHVD